MLKKLTYYLLWIFKCKILKQRIPLTGSFIPTDKCNLSCKHCTVGNLGNQDMSFEEAKRDLASLYNLGNRILIITGGEPYLWSDANKTLEDLVEYAQKLGYFRILVCTNGTFKLESNADYLWVSIDGLPREHNMIRGEGIYERVIKNIIQSDHPGIYINFVISKLNYRNIDSATDSLLKIKQINGILFHFFTPYIGSDKSLLLNSREKEELIARIRKIKKENPSKILNTWSGLKALKLNNWKRPIWSSITYTRGKKSICCCREGIYDEYVCENCGCTPAVETYVLEKMKVKAILENLRFI